MSDCLFCRICDNEIPATVLHRDDQVVAFLDVQPQAPFHALVIPVRHIASLDEARPDDAELLGRLMLTAAKIARDAGHAAPGYRVAINIGARAGQSVKHVHLHVLGGRDLGWPPG